MQQGSIGVFLEDSIGAFVLVGRHLHSLHTQLRLVGNNVLQRDSSPHLVQNADHTSIAGRHSGMRDRD